MTLELSLDSRALIVFLFALLCIPISPVLAQTASATPLNQIESKKELAAKIERKMHEIFMKQDKKDELVKLTENSFFGEDLRPLAGEPVLLVAQIVPWMLITGDRDDDASMVKFEVIQGEGTLKFFSNFNISTSEEPGTKELQTPATGGCYAMAWLVPKAGQEGEVVVRVSFIPLDEHYFYVDPKSEVFFTVKPILPPAGFLPVNVLRQKTREFIEATKPYLGVTSHFGQTYPACNGPLEPKVIIKEQGVEKTWLWSRDAKGAVKEESLTDEKSAYQREHQKWRWLPPDLKGRVTHVDTQGNRFGLVTWSRYNPDWITQGKDHFQPTHWDFNEYDPTSLTAGPFVTHQVVTCQDEPDGPEGAQLAEIFRSGLLSSNQLERWGLQSQLTYDVNDFWKVYRLDIDRVEDAGPFSAAALARMKKELEAEKGSASTEEVTDFQKKYGIVFRSAVASAKPVIYQFGNPAGAFVVSTDNSKPEGLLPNDIVILADKKLITDSKSFSAVLAAHDPKTLIAIVCWRNGSYRRVLCSPS